MNIVGNNAAGILNKLKSLEMNLKTFKPSVYFVQETKCRRKNKVSHPDYIVFEHIRKNSGGGGLLTAVHKNLKPVSVSDEDDIEILVVQGVIENKPVRFVNGYGPQDESNSTDEEKFQFFNRLDVEIKSAKMAGTMLCIQMDANSKLGPEYVPGDPKQMSKNGKLLAKVVDDNELIVVNGTQKCTGLITRYRKTVNSVEESVIDFFIVCKQFYSLVNSLVIDEERIFTLTKFSTKNGKKCIKESDHNTLVLNINTSWSSKIYEKQDRIEIYNYNNKEDFERFIEETDDNEDLRNCFNDRQEDINVACNKWLTILNNLIRKSFKRIRVNRKQKDGELEELFEKKQELKTFLVTHDMNHSLYDEKSELLEKVIDKIASICAQKNKETVEEYFSKEDDGLEGFNQARIWSLKKKLAPKNSEEPPMAKKDRHGNLVTEKSLLEKLYLDTYIERLKPNKIETNLKNLEKLKEFLFEIRYENCKTERSNDWSKNDLDKTLKTLKNKKARDAHGHIYEIFKYGGADLKKSILHMFNRIKDCKEYPDILKLSNITSLYKKKGERSSFDNDRGIFNTVKIRSILDKMIYNDYYDIIDSSMSSSNIGARKNRNIRDHLFVINAIFHEIRESKHENIDLEIYDVRKCFDKMWSKETANDIFDVGVKDDTFILIANSNKSCDIAVKTPWGSTTPRVEFKNIEMQGGVLTPLKCSVQLDTLGAECLDNPKNSEILYKFKGCVKIPPLEMIDDILTVTDCGIKSVKMNALVQSKIECKRLELSDTKCFKMHVGQTDQYCPNLSVNNKQMLSTSQQKYLGDIISSDTKLDENIKMRHDKGLGIVNQIISILKEVSFGMFYFEIGLLMRISMLVNGILFNTEAMFSVQQRHIDQLEDCDRIFMRKLFDSGHGTPIESFYIESNTWPLRFIILGRKFMYYWALLRKSEDELVKAVFNVQRNFPSRKKDDWVSEIKGELKNCNINFSDEEIKTMSKYTFKRIIREAIDLKVMSYLIELQGKHSKSKNLVYSSETQTYLRSNKLSTENKKILFKLR